MNDRIGVTFEVIDKFLEQNDPEIPTYKILLWDFVDWLNKEDEWCACGGKKKLEENVVCEDCL